MNPMRFGARLLLTTAVLVAAVQPAAAQTQGDGARVYWKTLAGANAITFWPILATGNANPIDPTHAITPNADFNAMLALVGAHKVLPVAGRSATLSVLVPVGNLQADVNGVPGIPTSSARGFGDPQVQFSINLAGAPAIRNLAQMARYEPRFTVDLLGAIAIPVGEYDSTQPLNIGLNRWFGRVGAPVVIALAPWIPGQRTTLEVVPAVWFFGDNDEHAAGTVSNDALFQLEAHATRDLTESLWASFDVSWFNGARPTINGVAGNSLNSPGVGFTLGFKVTDNLALNASYFSTVGDSAATDLSADEFRLMFTYGWHKLIESTKRIGR